MKRIGLNILAGLSLLLLMAGCDSDNTPEPEDPAATTGSIKLTASVDTITDEVPVGDREEEPQTRATTTDCTQYTLTVDGPDGSEEILFPDDGLLEGRKPGSYQLSLTSHPGGMPDPGFNAPVYGGSVSVNVEAGRQAAATLNCTQTNAGVCFIYDESLENAGFGNIEPIVAFDSKELAYSAGNRESIGYFAPGDVEITLSEDGNPVSIDGRETRNLTVEERKLYKVTLKVESGTSGITVTVEAVDTATGEDEWIIGNADLPANIRIIGAGNETISVKFTDGNVTPVRLDANGRGSFLGRIGKSVYSVKRLGQPEILAGVPAGQDFEIKVDVAGSIVYRDPDAGGNIPVGTYAELAMIDTDDATRDGKYLQEHDIDLMSLPWEPIGEWALSSSDMRRFTGVYDGNGKNIQNLVINKTDRGYVGLFGYSRGELKNIHISSGNIVGNNATGAICGLNESIISGCTTMAVVGGYGDGTGGICGVVWVSYVHHTLPLIENCVNKGNVMGSRNNYVGGICGNMSGGSIKNCINEAFISGSGTHVGGICGWSQTGVVVDGCKNIKASEINNLGQCTAGIVGYNGGTINNCRNEVPVWSMDDFNGGITGTNAGTVTGCVNIATVECEGTSSRNGGIAGLNHGVVENSRNEADIKGAYNATGGIVGWNNNTVDKCENTGSVSANPENHNTGGIVGANDGIVSSCVNRGAVTGDFSNAGGICGSSDSYLDNIDGMITDCVNWGKVTLAQGLGGGVCGHLYMGSIVNTVNHGDVSSKSYGGGICGQMSEAALIEACVNNGTVTVKTYPAGGVCGYMFNHGGNRIIASYNTGNVSAQQQVGGVIGYIEIRDSEVSACYSTGKVSGESNAGGVCGGNPAGAPINLSYWKQIDGGPSVGIGFVNEGEDNTIIFGAQANGYGWPSPSDTDWGVASGVGGDGKYWKEYGTWESHGSKDQYPRLWWQ